MNFIVCKLCFNKSDLRKKPTKTKPKDRRKGRKEMAKGVGEREREERKRSKITTPSVQVAESQYTF